MRDRVRRSLLSEREDGFTLVELIVAMLVMAIVFMAIIFVQARALTTNADSGSRQQATTYANEAMEQMRSIPWNILKKGMPSNYLAAGSAVIGGADPLVAGNVLSAEGTSVPLVVASSGTNDQLLTEPWAPLFDGTGSNIAIKFDPSGRGDEYIVKSYVTDDQAGNDVARGLAVVVEWTQRTNGEVATTVLFSTAYAPSGGCGDLNNAPFLASCQALFYSASSSANVVISASSSLPDDPDNPGTVADAGTPVPILPGSDFYTFQMATGGTAAGASSQQVSITDSYVRFGGTTRDDNLSATEAVDNGWTSGYESFTLRASDDLVNPGAAPQNPPDVTASATNSEEFIDSNLTAEMRLTARADDTRGGLADASVTQACDTGVGAAQVPATNPCATAKLAASTGLSGYMELKIAGDTIELGRVLHESGTTRDSSWVGRFTSGVLGNSVTGCNPLGGSGCVAGGADRYIGTINIGKITSGTGQWDDGKATNGLVRITDYHDGASAQRGTQQSAAPAAFSRSGTVAYWTGSGYTSLSLSAGLNTIRPIDVVTWTTTKATVTASGTLTITPSTSMVEGAADPSCKVAACTIDARNGNVATVVTYKIVPTDPLVAPFDLTISTVMNGSQAAASYKEPEDNA
jgi:prepilin-type N-terminal cleavage/methylation domain-containing protein